MTDLLPQPEGIEDLANYWRAYATAVERERDDLRAQAEWQPIETAPKDGSEIIGVHFQHYEGFNPTPYGPWTIAWHGKWQSSWGGSEVVSYMSDFGIDYKEPDCDPTHWKPLPSPPVTSTEGK